MVAARPRLQGRANGPQAFLARLMLDRPGLTVDGAQPVRIDVHSVRALPSSCDVTWRSALVSVGVARLLLSDSSPEMHANGRLTGEPGAELTRVLRDEREAWLFVVMFTGLLDAATSTLHAARFVKAGFERDPAWKRVTTAAVHSSHERKGRS